MMDEKVLQGLKDAIALWEKRAKGESGEGLCPLCLVCNGCDDCPVYKHTGKAGCDDTPFWDYAGAENPEEARRFAQAELDFLRSLLPDGEGES